MLLVRYATRYGSTQEVAGKMPASDIRDWTTISTWAGNLGVSLKLL